MVSFICFIPTESSTRNNMIVSNNIILHYKNNKLSFGWPSDNVEQCYFLISYFCCGSNCEIYSKYKNPNIGILICFTFNCNNITTIKKSKTKLVLTKGWSWTKSTIYPFNSFTESFWLFRGLLKFYLLLLSTIHFK